MTCFARFCTRLPQKLATELVANMTSFEELSELLCVWYTVKQTIPNVLFTWHMQMTYRQAVPFTASLNRGFLESVPSDGSINRNDDSVNKFFRQTITTKKARDKRRSA